ncbi:cell division protein FtsL [Thaumasiovibrio subtropicus]|uniref:cell division protein FtsL n=1 Tax=Thaumasiovibrio subtropicus TaxID=1891207 RepID=UPI000B3505B1|nr:cell division protein FtsL [Thaumasiovibrio subtropicus]
MPNEQDFNLAKHIGADLISAGRVPLILFILVMSSALGVVFVTHNTREQISLREQLLQEQDQLDIEWRNQLLEESALTEHSLVEDVAERRLEMQRPATNKEVIIY